MDNITENQILENNEENSQDNRENVFSNFNEQILENNREYNETMEKETAEKESLSEPSPEIIDLTPGLSMAASESKGAAKSNDDAEIEDNMELEENDTEISEETNEVQEYSSFQEDLTEFENEEKKAEAENAAQENSVQEKATESPEKTSELQETIESQVTVETQEVKAQEITETQEKKPRKKKAEERPNTRRSRSEVANDGIHAVDENRIHMNKNAFSFLVEILDSLKAMTKSAIIRNGITSFFSGDRTHRYKFDFGTKNLSISIPDTAKMYSCFKTLAKGEDVNILQNENNLTVTNGVFSFSIRRVYEEGMSNGFKTEVFDELWDFLEKSGTLVFDEKIADTQRLSDIADLVSKIGQEKMTLKNEGDEKLTFDIGEISTGKCTVISANILNDGWSRMRNRNVDTMMSARILTMPFVSLEMRGFSIVTPRKDSIFITYDGVLENGFQSRVISEAWRDRHMMAAMSMGI